MENQLYQRDKNGDIIFPETSSEFWAEQHASRHTHVFHFKSPDGFFLDVDYEKFRTEDMRTDLQKFELAEHRIFKTPDPPISEDWIRRSNTYDYYLETFFRPVLARGLSEQGFPLRVDIFRLVLPKEQLANMLLFIEQSGLKEHEDFILYLIAKIEYIYVHDVEFYDQPEERKRIKQFPEEIDRLVKVLKFSEHDYSDEPRNQPKPDLQYISFNYNTELAIKITDSLLLSSITKGTMEHFMQGQQQNWEKELKAFPYVYTENQQPNEFRYRVCKALHNFFKAIHAFDFGDKKTTDTEVYAIARIVDFAHVKFHDRAGREFEIDADKHDIQKNVRHAIKRKELVYHRTHFTSQEIKPDYEKLLKYFEIDFIAGGQRLYNAYDIRLVGTITDRFGINPLLPEMAHIFNCLKQRLFQVGGQFEALFNPEIEQNEDYRSWKALIENINSNGKIKGFQFTEAGSNKTYGFSELLSLEIMEKAVSEYHKKHPFEFDVDFYESSVELKQPPGSFRLVTTGHLHQPKNRFFSIFCKQCYAFLLKEVPPGERDWKPSERYFGIIAQLLLQSFFFKHKMWEEDYILEQVKYWFEL